MAPLAVGGEVHFLFQALGLVGQEVSASDVAAFGRERDFSNAACTSGKDSNLDSRSWCFIALESWDTGCGVRERCWEDRSPICVLSIFSPMP